MKKALLFIFLLTLIHSVVAQDPYFSQAYSAPMVLNPALAGSTGSGRLSGIVKSISSGDITSGYTAYHFAYDQMINKISSGIGIYYTGEEWYNFTKSQRFGLNYAVPIKIGKMFRITPAVELSGMQMSYAITPDSMLRDKVTVFDPGAGLLMNSDRFNLGVVAKHFLKPDISPIKTGGSGMDSRYSLVADYVFGKINEKRSWKITPGIRYSLVNPGSSYNDIQFSLTAVYHKLKFGFAYRSSFDLPSDAASAVISYNGWLFKFRYAYDFFTKTYSNEKRMNGHEVTMLFNIFGKKKKDDFVESPNYAF